MGCPLPVGLSDPLGLGVFSASSSITDAGTLQLSTSITASVAGSITTGAVVISAGTMTIDGVYNVSGSTTVSTAAGATLTVNPAATLTSLGTTLAVSNDTLLLNALLSWREY